MSIIITTFSGSLYPYIFGKLVDEVFYVKNMDKFLEIILIYGVIYLFNQGMHFVLNISWAKLMTEFLFDIRRAIFNKVISMKGKELSGLYSGDIINRMSSDTEQVMNFIHWNVFYSFGGLISLSISLAFIFYLCWQLGVLTLILTPISVYLSRYFAKKLKVVNDKIKKKNGLLVSWYFEIIKGLREIRILSAARNVLSRYLGRIIKITRLRIDAMGVSVKSERINSGLSLVVQLFLYSLSAYFIINGQLTLGGFTAIVSYFGKCVGIFNSLNSKITAIADNISSIERIQDILNKESEEYNDNRKPILIKNGNISFKNIYFKYNADMEVLEDINFNIKHGDIISLVGYSGAGKSTLANLIFKLYEPLKGAIEIDGININDFNLHNLREQIGIVHQDTYLYKGSIRYNISFSDDKNRDNELYEVLKKAYLFDYVDSLPNKLDTIIGGQNNSLSGGQAQRLAIARVFLKNPKIIIFDEATSSLDFEAELSIKKSWKDLCKNRTIIVIAHRLSTIINSDKIAVIHEGKIVGYDNHNILIKNSTHYIQLFNEQFKKDGIEV